MKTTARGLLTLFSIAIIATLSACASGPKVDSDYDQNYNFGAIKSYYLEPDNQKEYLGLPGESLTNQRITKSIQSEMKRRGIVAKPAAEADILIAFHVTTKDKTRVTSYNTAYGYRPYGYGYGGMGTSNVDVRQYTEGSLFIDLVNPKDKKTVWRGIASAILKDRTTEERIELINSYVGAIINTIPDFTLSKK